MKDREGRDSGGKRRKREKVMTLVYRV
jgi:hypothetical protein